MRDHQTAMSVYVQLALIADQKQQSQVRDRLLLLAGVEACRAGWPDVACHCRKKLVESNPAHQARQFPTLADALRDEQFQQLVARWERYCPFEKAEAMLKQLDLPAPDTSGTSLGDVMLAMLGSAN